MGRRATAVRIGAVVRRGALAATVAALLAACQNGPAPPLLSPLGDAKRYGYTERDLGPDRIEVSYLGPRHRLTYLPAPRAAEPQPATTEAFDLATWRVAQLALARGFRGFRVVDRVVQIDSHPEAFAAGPEAGPWPYWRYPGGFIYGPSASYSTPFTQVQARITVTADLVNDLQPGDDDARAVIDRRRAVYGPADSAAPTR